MTEISDMRATFCDWSSDGKHIVFSRSVTVDGGTIWIMGSDGHNPRPLIPHPGPEGFVTHRLRPRWSPDGKQIVFRQTEYKCGASTKYR